MCQTYRVQPHGFRKLRAIAAAMKLEPILSGHETRGFPLVPTSQTEIAFLKLQLPAIELRLEALSIEKAELERRLEVFNCRYAEALGDLIQRALEARAKLAQYRVQALDGDENTQTRAQAETEAEEADAQFREYAKGQRTLFEEPPPPVLGQVSEQELKCLYRKACSLCHPDKVADGQQAQANEIFQALQEAYRRNDLQRVREIHTALKTDALLTPRSTFLNEMGAFQAAIAQMESAITTLMQDIQILRDSDAVRFMETTTDFDTHVHRQRQVLETELERLEKQIQQYREYVG
jgi:hypothetical protein